MYIGDCTPREEEHFEWDGNQMARQTTLICPGLEKLLFEAIDNATDNMHRVPPTTEISITLTDTLFACSNNGAHIPIQQKEGQWIPSTIFTEMHSGSNFDDVAAMRVAAGMNGLGIKLAAILSDDFIVECVDPIAGLHFFQQSTGGLETIHPAIIRPATKKQLKGMTTTVRFVPRLEHFGVHSLLPFASRIRTRLVQLSCTIGGRVRFVFNGDRIKPQSFQQYMQSFPYTPVVYGGVQGAVEYGFALSDNDEMSHHAFVNHLHTEEGGTHVTALESQITGAIFAHFDKKKRKHEDVRLSRANIRSRLVLFCSVQVPNPSFKSQSKRFLTTPFTGCILEPPMILKMARKCGLLDSLAQMLEGKATVALGNALNSRKKRTLQIDNLTDAVCAGTVRSKQCSLFVVEGLSAKTFAVSGMAELGNQLYGIYPIRGKPINLYNASPATIAKNREIGELCKILGLTLDKDYSTEAALSTLRYRYMIILTDADVDGYHICGLLVAFLQRLFPTLLESGFVKRFVTPIIIATRSKEEQREFFNLRDYNLWAREAGHGAWTVKYFKGLGSSTKEQARGYFRRLDRYIKPMVTDGQSALRISLLFDTKKADLRKLWMQSTVPSSLDYLEPTMSVTRFIDTEMHDFSMETLTRSIPSMMDGLKESQRKVLYAAIKKCATTKNQEIKIAQLGAYAAETTAYAHGEKSIQDTCNKMTHSFVGSNNLHLLEACGNTGSRLQMGGDAASTRYTFTRLMPYTRQVFHPLDDPLLVQRVEEGMAIEYHEYAPILPMILINGCAGIATGYRTLLPCHRVSDVLCQLKRRLSEDLPFQPIVPYYADWTGTIQETESEWTFTGRCTLSGRRCVITELPIAYGTERYKTNVLHALVDKHHISNLVEAHPDENRVRFEFDMLPSFVLTMLELSGTMSKRCMNLLVDGCIRCFTSVLEIMELYFTRRLALYARRRACLIERHGSEQVALRHRRDFIQHVLEDRIVIRRTSKAGIVARAIELGIPPVMVDSFVQMSFLSLTNERVAELDSKLAASDHAVRRLTHCTPKGLWLADLDLLQIDSSI